jgi:hypothetical protein
MKGDDDEVERFVFWGSRRALLSAFSALAALAPLRPASALAQGTTSGDLSARGDLLPSWNDRASKNAIVAFVERVTTQGAPDFVPEAERIATFDNDGTLWAEQPLYFQLLFALDRVKELAPQHPEWKTTEPFASLLRGDVKAVLAGGEKATVPIVIATHSGMTSEEFNLSFPEIISARSDDAAPTERA